MKDSQSLLNLEKTFSFSHYSDGAKKHLANVYLSVLACLICTAFGVATPLSFQDPLHKLVKFFGVKFNPNRVSLFLALVLLRWIYNDSQKGNLPRRVAMLCVFGFLRGLNLVEDISLAIATDSAIVMTALIGAMTIFVCFSVAAMLAQRRSWLFLGGSFSSATTLLLLGFDLDSQLYWLLLSVLFVLFVTQSILEKAEKGSRDVVGHALLIYLDFFTIGSNLLQILIRKAGMKKN